MAQKAMFIIKNGNIVSKEVFGGDSDTGISNRQTHIAALNPSASLTYTIFNDSNDATFISASVVPDDSFIRF